ncbi:hypothetical protein GCM10009827_097980 [Dactylosporangium maewongense]|uniref:Uncharacterized protein n=1 Tax=Dactylosporangium maewongense TaxID=634393 RepID=A0ABN2CNH3_9ACTN
MLPRFAVAPASALAVRLAVVPGVMRASGVAVAVSAPVGVVLPTTLPRSAVMPAVVFAVMLAVGVVVVGSGLVGAVLLGPRPSRPLWWVRWGLRVGWRDGRGGRIGGGRVVGRSVGAVMNAERMSATGGTVLV